MIRFVSSLALSFLFLPVFGQQGNFKVYSLNKNYVFDPQSQAGEKPPFPTTGPFKKVPDGHVLKFAPELSHEGGTAVKNHLKETIGFTSNGEFVATNDPLFEYGIPFDLTQEQWTLGKVAQHQYVKDTYVSNQEYREFVHYVRDSIARTHIANEVNEAYYILDENGENPRLNWSKKMHWSNPDEHEVLNALYYREAQRNNHRKAIDARKLCYRYHWKTTDATTRKEQAIDEVVNVYPDTLCWVRNLKTSDQKTLALRKGLVEYYFNHSYFDAYPVVGLNQHQVEAFLAWKTRQHQQAIHAQGAAYKLEYNLPDVKMASATPAQNQTLVISEMPSDQKEIIQADYKAFLRYTIDSAVHRELGYYYDENHFIFDEECYEKNAFIPLNWKRKIFYGTDAPYEVLQKFYRKGITKEAVTKTKREHYQFLDSLAFNFTFQQQAYEQSVNDPRNHDLDLGIVNVHGRRNVSHWSEDRSLFLPTLMVNVFPNLLEWHQAANAALGKSVTFWSKTADKLPMRGITEAQRMAYWTWKQQQSRKVIYKAAKENPLKQGLYHPEAQQGAWQETAKLSLPAPAFRYVISVQPILNGTSK